MVKKKKDTAKDKLDYKKQKAIYLLASKNWKKKEVAQKVGISVRLLNAWLDLPAFQNELNRWMKRLSGADKEFRVDQSRKLLPFLYEELFRRCALDPNELEDMTNRDLFSMLKIIQNEMRLDTPGEATKKVEHFNLDTLSERYNRSTSGKAIKKRNGVTSIEEHKDKRASNAED